MQEDATGVQIIFSLQCNLKARVPFQLRYLALHIPHPAFKPSGTLDDRMQRMRRWRQHGCVVQRGRQLDVQGGGWVG